MFMNVVCPTCGKKCRVAESALGQVAQCPACAQSFQCGSVSPKSLQTFPVPADRSAQVSLTPQVNTVDGIGNAVHYRCPRCARQLVSPAHQAGQKINCPDCSQRLQIPQTSENLQNSKVDPAALAASQRTAVPDAYARLVGTEPVPFDAVLPTLNQPTPTVHAVSPSPGHPAIPSPIRVESCLECGVDLTHRTRAHTCPDCSSLLCSASCFREHRYHAHPSRRRR
jgi:DNA-directed RNA polymerase subunit RPC12/RpoP